MSYPLLQRLIAEALGTMLLVATVVGSGIMATNLTKDIALQLLCNALPTGAILVVIITIFGSISGAHFNPVVSFIFALKRELSFNDLLAYCAAQCFGAVAGTMIAHIMFGLPTLVIGTTMRSGSALWFSEVIATFALVLTILGTLKAKKEAVPINVGLVIIAAYWFTSSTSFANPAVTLARGFTQSFSGILLSDVPMFIAMQIIGALLGSVLSVLVFRTYKA
jgi:glycerol uptake facilitator-like aquaporin